MAYMDIVNLIMIILGALLAIFPIQYFVIFLLGILSKPKKFPQADEKLRYGIVIAGRNEEKVIGNLIQSVQKSNYPQDKIDIFVVAHNCTDKTAQIARENGAIGYEYDNPEERTKGYALKYIFERINEDYGIKSYDGFHIFDADNVLDNEYLNKMNDAFLAHDRKNVIMGFRNSKNFGANTLTSLYGVLYISECRIESVGRSAINVTTRLIGSGYLINSEMLKNGWESVIMSDDIDFTAEQVLNGENVVYCSEAMYYDEHPTTFKAMWRQRLRWAKGVMLVGKKRYKDLFKSMFRRKKKGSVSEPSKPPLRVSSLDLIFKVVPFAFLGLLVTILQIILIALAHLFGYDAATVWTDWAISFAINTAIGYGILIICPIMSFILERKRIKNVPFRLKITATLTWPLFILLLLPLQVVAMFTKKFSWKPIVHTDASNFETFNNTKNVDIKNGIQKTNKVKEKN